VVRARGRVGLAVAVALALLTPLVVPGVAWASTPPVITSAGSTTFTSGSAGTFAVTSTGSPTPALSESGALPSGVTFVDNGNATATLAGTATAVGTYTLTITAHNTASPDATQTFTLTVIQAWYNASWLYRKTITINHAKVAAHLSNFPVLVSITDAGLATSAQSSGNDILFTASDGVTKLNHQIESYTSGTGALVAWVSVTSVSRTVDTTVYMYYGNGAAASQQNASGTWDANYRGVWHFNQSPTGSTNDILDSTSNANNGSSQGSMTSGNQVSGQFSGSLSFNGSANYVSTANLMTVPQVYTEEAWVKTSTASGHKIFGFESNQTGTGSTSWNTNIYIGSDGQAYAGIFNVSFPTYSATYATAVNDNVWHDVVATYDSGTTVLSLYVDGTLRSTTAVPAVQSSTGYWRMGSYKLSGWTNGSDGFYTGGMDEVRLSTTARSAGWITTEYNNENSPSTFVSVGSQQAFVPIAPVITSASSATFTSGSAGTFVVTSTGSPTPALSESGALPSGVTFVDNGNATATLSGTPAAFGTYTLTITAHSSASPDATQTFTLTVIQAWYNASWLYRKTITVDHTKVGASLSNFPVLVSMTDAGLAAHAQSSGNDILFTSSDGVTKLNHQIESYTSGTGVLVAWVDVPSVSNTVDTIIYLYYGNAAAASQQNASGTWDANYKGVWHFSQSPTGSAGDILDSTSNANNGSSQGSMTSGNQVAGQFGGSLSFNGTANYVSTANLMIAPQVYTEEAWVKTSTASGHKIFGFESSQTGTGSTSWNSNIYIGSNGQVYAGVFDGVLTTHIITYATAINNNVWHHVVATYDSGTTLLSLYVDGVLRVTTTSSAAQNFNGYWRMGSYKLSGFWTNGSDGFFTGGMDEVRLSTTARSAGWISTEYNNENSPSTFASVSAEQVSVPIAPAITSASSATFTTGSANTFTVTATGSPTPALTETGTLPTGITFVDNGNATATLSGTPTSSGTYTLTITAHSTASPDATQTFTLTMAQPWYDANWLYRKAVTIDHTKVGASLSNFPFLVSITDAGLATYAQSSGNDILFTASDGTTKLNHQIESYTSGTGALVAWVNVPSVSNTVDTVIYLYYGNGAAANQQNATAVWDANYTDVWHLSEGPTGTAPQFKDSTSSPNNGTAQGSIPAGAQVAGAIDGSITLNGTANYISTTNQLTVPNTDTISAWFKTTTASGAKIIGFESNQTGAASANYDRMLWVGTDGKLRFGMFDGTLRIVASSTTVTDGAWHYAVGVEDNTAHTVTLYVDGSAVAAISTGTTPQSYTGWWRIGSYMMYSGWTNSAAGYFPGGVDEARISTVVRSAGWISTEYNNQHSPSTFASLGTAQAPLVITSANSATFTAGMAGAFTVTASGSPTPTLTETGALPTGVTFVDNGNATASLTGTASNTGSFTLTVTAHNTAGPDAVQIFTFTVAAGTLSISVPGTAILGSGTLGSTTSGNLGTVQVIDDRGGTTAAWTATVSATALTSGGQAVPLADLQYWSGPATATTGTGAFTPGQATAGSAQDLTTSRTAFTLGSGTGANNASWNPTIVVIMPLTAIPGFYVGTITHSVA
jgi:hypothetical protein